MADRHGQSQTPLEMDGVKRADLIGEVGRESDEGVREEKNLRKNSSGFHSAMWDLMMVAGPTIAAMTSFTLMQFIDKVMVSRIGPEPIYVGAQGNGGLASWAPIAVGYGLLNVVNTYVAQNLGAGRAERGAAYAWAGIWLSVMYWAGILIPLGILLPTIFAFMRESGMAGEVLPLAVARDQMAGEYGRILLFGGVITLASRGISQYFYGLHRASIVLAATIIGNLTNIFFNALLIYGVSEPTWNSGPLDMFLREVTRLAHPIAESLGISGLGVKGAALGTLIGTCVELVIPMGLFVSRGFRRKYQTLAHWRFSIGHARDLIRTGWPQGVMFGNEMLCWAFFMVYLVGQFGARHSTAGWIAHQWMSMSFMPTVGLSIAVTAAVGKALGARRPDLAATRAWTGVVLALGYMGACGVGFVIFGREMVELFVEKNTPTEDVELIVRLGTRFLLLTAAFQLFDAVAMTIGGALRGAGDTLWPGVATLVLSWGVIVAGGLGMVRYMPQLESMGPWIAASAYIIVLSVVLWWRWIGGKWKTMNLLEHSVRE